jgi:3-oxoacyl-[acyl-carrier protein] reductase
MKHLRNRKALVTGAASGIGRSIALALAEQGAHVALLDIDAEGLSDVTEQVRALGVQALTLQCDLTRPDAITAAVRDLRAQWPDIHILVNNAGICYYQTMDRMTAEQWDHVLAINFHAPLQLIRELITVLQAQDEAHIVNLCSMFGLVSYRHIAAYTMSKHAMVGLTKAMRCDYAGSGMGASAICPGFVHGTTFFDSAKRTPPRWLCCTPPTVARRTITAIRRNRAMTVITPLARLVWWADRLCPWLLDAAQQLGWGASRRRKRRQARSKTT